ncbi:MAG: hypothetical protein GW925_02260 [Candidatus Pacebacteria bacterium]|nr:hypothetical protein [Candidatus Paceibacterota bacterium]PIZ79680.1 MAG: hypothetical protein COY01_00045 [Candidatus Pacebacteria bacterium CG_4_10_14_0_2_um_filter_40_20]
MPKVFDSETHSRKQQMKKKSPSSSTSDASKTVNHRHVDDYSDVLASEPSCDRVFTSFAPKPKHTRFESQATTENVVLLLRQHPITQVKWILVVLFFGIVPMSFPFLPVYSFLPISYRLGLTFLWYLALFGYSFQLFLKWFYNVYILTDERVIDVDFISLAQKNITAAKIDNIEDITSESVGFSSTFFDHGTVLIQTAGAAQEITFEAVPYPAKVTAVLNDLLLEEEREKIEGRTH